MEATLRVTEQYWGRPLRGAIECYVVHDLDKWHDRNLPHPMARVLIARVGGATVGKHVAADVQHRGRAIVFASTVRGVAEHEVVHAYCGQTFGGMGPDWYKEGMAQMLTYRSCLGEGVHCPPRVLQAVRTSRHRSLRGILTAGAFSRDLSNALNRKANKLEQDSGLIPLEDWSEEDVRCLQKLHQSYSWSWLACHMLDENPNYRTRFRCLGESYLTNRGNRRSHLFDALASEMEFEFRFMIERLSHGYRADLCSWDWNKRFRPLDARRDVRVTVSAKRGYQPSGLVVESGKRYCYHAEGAWKVSNAAAAVGAEGGKHAWGALEGVIMDDFQLGQPFLLRNRCQFIAPSNGRLYLRCRDQWNQIADNEGELVVVFKRRR
jgi:hypothetical protein